jgi:hypothetical protein
MPDTLRMLPSQNPSHLLGLSFLFAELCLLLGLCSLQLPLAGSLGLRTLGIHLLLEDSLTRLLRLSSVDLP